MSDSGTEHLHLRIKTLSESVRELVVENDQLKVEIEKRLDAVEHWSKRSVAILDGLQERVAVLEGKAR